MSGPAQTVQIGASGRPGTLTLPPRLRGLVIWSGSLPGDGCARPSAADAAELVAVLARQGLATLQIDALETTAGLVPAEEPGVAARARGPMQLAQLAAHAVAALDWAAGRADLCGLRTALSAPGLAAAAALVAATQRPARVAAIVARSGRPDLAGAALGRVSVPTLLIVGGDDADTVLRNRAALQALNCEKRLEVVPGAGACFDEPGARATMLHLAAEWLADRLAGGSARH